ncbi:hypothetical protein V6N11_070224 [Hibiscus sabdariffa]|uniref:Uncharacterized protein n=1 Tax=Hibiscus sabdariffa TaxID=183260 RepID=A0ABR2QEY1_9ROSI
MCGASILAAMDLLWKMEPITSLLQIFPTLVSVKINSQFVSIGKSGIKSAEKHKRIQKVMLASKIVLVWIQKMAHDICASAFLVLMATLISAVKPNQVELIARESRESWDITSFSIEHYTNCTSTSESDVLPLMSDRTRGAH